MSLFLYEDEPEWINSLELMRSKEFNVKIVLHNLEKTQEHEFDEVGNEDYRNGFNLCRLYDNNLNLI